MHVRIAKREEPDKMNKMKKQSDLGLRCFGRQLVFQI